ncbi:hypothetical protein [Nitrospirillum iridis]|uniref:Uncharacterized protein n=1 Tax=Nitrospirillum iridis TaxID=765888 RepID=A0A7X0AZV5_9PROT|nr:hypothetical protein [Nitrospirillum iridis]MBB6251766.1 hypothetical protein [Nitrospirillum iridis]
MLTKLTTTGWARTATAMTLVAGLASAPVLSVAAWAQTVPSEDMGMPSRQGMTPSTVPPAPDATSPSPSNSHTLPGDRGQPDTGTPSTMPPAPSDQSSSYTSPSGPSGGMVTEKPPVVQPLPPHDPNDDKGKAAKSRKASRHMAHKKSDPGQNNEEAAPPPPPPASPDGAAPSQPGNPRP